MNSYRGGFGERGRGGEGGPRYSHPSSNRWPRYGAPPNVGNPNSKIGEEPKPILLTANTGFQVAAQVAKTHSQPATPMLPPGIQAPGPRPAVPLESQDYRAWYEKWYTYSQATGDMSYEELQTTSTNASNSCPNWDTAYHNTVSANQADERQSEASSNSGFRSQNSVNNDDKAQPNPPNSEEYYRGQSEDSNKKSTNQRNPGERNEGISNVNQNRNLYVNAFEQQRGDKPNDMDNKRDFPPMRNVRGRGGMFGPAARGMRGGRGGREPNFPRENYGASEGQLIRHHRDELAGGYRISEEENYNRSFHDNYSRDGQLEDEPYQDEVSQQDQYVEHDSGPMRVDRSKRSHSDNESVPSLMSVAFKQANNKNLGPRGTSGPGGGGPLMRDEQFADDSRGAGEHIFPQNRRDMPIQSNLRGKKRDLPLDREYAEVGTASSHSMETNNFQISNQRDTPGNSHQFSHMGRNNFYPGNRNQNMEISDNMAQTSGKVEHMEGMEPPARGNFMSNRDAISSQSSSIMRDSNKSNTALMATFMTGATGTPDQDAINEMMGAAMKNNPPLVQGIMAKMSSGNMDSDAMTAAMNQIMMTAMMGNKSDLQGENHSSNLPPPGKSLAQMRNSPHSVRSQNVRMPGSTSNIIRPQMVNPPNNIDQHLGKPLNVSGPRMGSQSNAMGPRMGSQSNTMGPRMGSQSNTMGPRMWSQSNSMGPRMGSQLNTMGPRMGSQSNTMGPQMESQSNTMGPRMENQSNTMGPRMENQSNTVSPRMGSQLNTIGPRMGSQSNTMGPRMGSQSNAMGPRMESQSNTIGPRMGNQANTMGPRMGNQSNNNAPRIGNTMSHISPRMTHGSEVQHGVKTQISNMSSNMNMQVGNTMSRQLSASEVNLQTQSNQNTQMGNINPQINNTLSKENLQVSENLHMQENMAAQIPNNANQHMGNLPSNMNSQMVNMSTSVNLQTNHISNNMNHSMGNMANNRNHMGTMSNSMNPQMDGMSNSRNTQMMDNMSQSVIPQTGTMPNINRQMSNVVGSQIIPNIMGSQMSDNIGSQMGVMGNAMGNTMNVPPANSSNNLGMPIVRNPNNMGQMGNTINSFNPQMGPQSMNMPVIRGRQFPNAEQEGPPMKKMKGVESTSNINMSQELGSSGNGQFGQAQFLPGGTVVVQKTNLLFGDQIKKAKRAGMDISQMFVCCQVCDDVWGEKNHPIVDYLQHHINTHDHTKALVAWIKSHPNQRYQEMLTIPPHDLKSSSKSDHLEDQLKGAHFCEVCEMPAGYCKKIYKKHLKKDNHVKKMMSLVSLLKPRFITNQNQKPSELKDVEYILVPQRLPRLTKDKNRFKTFPCQTCSVAANDAAELGFDNWVEHIVTQFHMSILYDWMARCKAPAALPYQHVLNFKPSEMKDKQDPHYFCEICSKRVTHVDKQIEKHTSSAKHKKKYAELKESIEEALSGGPVTRILPEDDTTDTGYPDDLDEDWRHPSDIKKSEAQQTKRKLEEEQRKQMEEKQKQQKEVQKQQQMRQQQELEKRRQEQRAREDELRELRQQEMQLLRVQRDEEQLTERDFEMEQCRLMLVHQKREDEQNRVMAQQSDMKMPVNQPMDPQLNHSMQGNQLPFNQQKMPETQQQMMPFNQQQKMPLNQQQRMPLSQQMPISQHQNQRMPLNQMPQNQQGPVPQNQQRPMAPSHQGPMLQNQQGSMLQNQQVPMPQNQQGPMPQNQQGPMPQNQQGPIPQNQRGPMPQNQQGPMPQNQQGLMPQNQQGPMPQNQQGPMLQNQQGPMPLSQQGSLPQNQKGPMPLNQQGPMPLNQQGPMPLNQQGPMPQNQQGPMPQNQQGPMLQNQQGPMPQNQQGPMIPNQQQMMQNQVQQNQRMPLNPMQPGSQNQQCMPMIQNQQHMPLNQQQMVPNQQQRMLLNQQLPMMRNQQPMQQNLPIQMPLNQQQRMINPQLMNQPRPITQNPQMPNNQQALNNPNPSNNPQNNQPPNNNKFDPQLAKVPNPNTKVPLQLNKNFAAQMGGGDGAKERPSGRASVDDRDNGSGDMKIKGGDTKMVNRPISDRTKRNRGPETYVLFPQRLDILATLSEFPSDAYCEICPQVPFFDNIIDWAAHINTLEHMQALFHLAVSKSGPAAEHLFNSVTMPVRNHAQNKYSICETCLIMNSEQNMLPHIVAKKHILILKNIGTTMKNLGGWMQQYVIHNNQDYWNKHFKKPGVISGNPVVIRDGAPGPSSRAETVGSLVKYDVTTGSSTADLFDLKDPQIGFLHSVLTGVVSLTSYKKLKATKTITPHIETKMNEEQRVMILKMCTKNGHLVISIARRVIEAETKSKILEYYPEVNPQLIDIIAGLQPDVLKLIATTPILDSPPQM